MGNYKYILFDLDGTLTDSADGIINSVLYTLKKNGIEENDRAKLRTFVGPPLSDSFRKYYGASDEQIAVLRSGFHEYFDEKGWCENRVYEGIPEVLAKLKAEGKSLILATSKPEVFARRIMEHFGLAQYFDVIGGSTLDGTRSKKAAVIAYVLEQVGSEHLPEMVMVGDREHDVLGAKEHGIPCVGVLYGYGDRAELETAGAAAVCPDVASLPEYL